MSLNARTLYLHSVQVTLVATRAGAFLSELQNPRRRSPDHNFYLPVPILGFLNDANVVA
jgi:hypothetical protein